MILRIISEFAWQNVVTPDDRSKLAWYNSSGAIIPQ